MGPGALKGKMGMALQHVTMFLEYVEGTEDDRTKRAELEGIFPWLNEATYAGMKYARGFLTAFCAELALKALIEGEKSEEAPYDHRLDHLWEELESDTRHEVAKEVLNQGSVEKSDDWDETISRDTVTRGLEVWVGNTLKANSASFVQMRYLDKDTARSSGKSLHTIVCALLTVADRRGILG